MATARILINVFDGTRQLMGKKDKILLRVRDGDQREVFSDFIKTPTLMLEVPFHDNLRDNYTVIASSKGYIDAGYFPVRVSPKILRPVFIMLLPRNSEYNFRPASWTQLKKNAPKLFAAFSHGATQKAARKRYEDTLENRSDSLACLLNIVTIMRDVNLARGSVLDYLRGVVWDERLRQDRFFAYADPELLNQVRLATEQGGFSQEPGPGLLHPGATCSFKEVQFGEANLQLTFHENAKPPAGTNWVTIEPDIDYFKDIAAHALLEVLPHKFGSGPTDPKFVYVLRWMAGRHANIPEFDPPYVIRARG